ncbi:hypothetical protein GRF59_13695 [Paenibacillus sp. HJL G12]|uniref:Uncharacterized protein n=1 Tax=Paenibacillus dendrobii TaxID=2691084 RepID=A0A7X3IIP9_9BACL|nr:hypothetical protein [Paenibacillus dendrobii]MWV44667.1 hypothetical protein [Paenibacillus dendrobii]
MSENKQALPLPEEWAAYIRGEVSPRRAEWMESLLLADEQAFTLYMQAMDLEAQALPALEEPEHFANKVMDQLGSSGEKINPLPAEPKDRNRRWYEHRMFHYAIAACLTLIFLSAGWFDKLTLDPQQAGHAGRVSYSEELVRVTTGWLDRMKP